MFHGALRVTNFFVVSLRARNVIQAIKLLAFSKMEEVGFFVDFRGRIGAVERVPRYLHRNQFFYSYSAS